MFKSKSRANLTDFLNQISNIYSNEKPKKTILLRSIPVLNSSKSLLMVQSAVEPDPDDPPASASANTSASASAGRVHTPGHHRGQEAMTSRDFEKLKRRAMEVRLTPPSSPPPSKLIPSFSSTTSVLLRIWRTQNVFLTAAPQELGSC